ncbi:hypothetical protein Mag101_11930 [Microbulbifer agarilyticus]|uniref:Uncharacterized protein n=1 Tax=Microbulbifer agarilyticus TaxID=260552 RepID=A0A1Q2M7R5_9GAMM|nr:hypothetical protein Mag101_11930 [Microbulbifer agarilyticus]
MEEMLRFFAVTFFLVVLITIPFGVIKGVYDFCNWKNFTKKGYRASAYIFLLIAIFLLLSFYYWMTQQGGGEVSGIMLFVFAPAPGVFCILYWTFLGLGVDRNS